MEEKIKKKFNIEMNFMILFVFLITKISNNGIRFQVLLNVMKGVKIIKKNKTNIYN